MKYRQPQETWFESTKTNSIHLALLLAVVCLYIIVKGYELQRSIRKCLSRFAPSVRRFSAQSRPTTAKPLFSKCVMPVMSTTTRSKTDLKVICRVCMKLIRIHDPTKKGTLIATCAECVSKRRQSGQPLHGKKEAFVYIFLYLNQANGIITWCGDVALLANSLISNVTKYRKCFNKFSF